MSISLSFSSPSSSSSSGSGDGGGVCSYFRGTLLGGGGGDIEGESACDRFIFFEGGCSSAVEGGERRAAARDAWDTGRCMPRDGNESDFLRVL